MLLCDKKRIIRILEDISKKVAHKCFQIRKNFIFRNITEITITYNFRHNHEFFEQVLKIANYN